MVYLRKSFLLQKSFCQVRECHKMLRYVVFPNSPVQLLNICLIHPLIGPGLLNYLPVFLRNLEVQLEHLLIIPWIVVVRNRVPLLPRVDHPMRSRLVEPSGCFFQHVGNVDHEMSRDRVDVNPLIVNIFSLKSLFSSHQHCYESIVTMLPKRLSFLPVLLRNLRVVKKHHQCKMVLANRLTEDSSLQSQRLSKSLHQQSAKSVHLLEPFLNIPLQLWKLFRVEIPAVERNLVDNSRVTFILLSSQVYPFLVVHLAIGSFLSNLVVAPPSPFSHLHPDFPFFFS